MMVLCLDVQGTRLKIFKLTSSKTLFALLELFQQAEVSRYFGHECEQYLVVERNRRVVIVGNVGEVTIALCAISSYCYDAASCSN